MQQSNRRPPPAPLDLRQHPRPHPVFRSAGLPPPTPPPWGPLPALPVLTPPPTPCSPLARRLPADRCPSRTSAASSLSPRGWSPAYLGPHSAPDGQQRATISRRPSWGVLQDNLALLPTRFHEDEDVTEHPANLHPFARVDDTETLYSPTMSTFSGTTAVSGVDARIAELEAQVRELQVRLQPELRPSKSMPLLRRLRLREERCRKDSMGQVEPRKSGKTVRTKGGRVSVLGTAEKSGIDLSHLVR
ncbi:unnamed protein product [Cutaneotrichosporon oleaginosum]